MVSTWVGEGLGLGRGRGRGLELGRGREPGPRLRLGPAAPTWSALVRGSGVGARGRARGRLRARARAGCSDLLERARDAERERARLGDDPHLHHNHAEYETAHADQPHLPGQTRRDRRLGPRGGAAPGAAPWGSSGPGALLKPNGPSGPGVSAPRAAGGLRCRWQRSAFDGAGAPSGPAAAARAHAARSAPRPP